jgi:hypothetical protein
MPHTRYLVPLRVIQVFPKPTLFPPAAVPCRITKSQPRPTCGTVFTWFTTPRTTQNWAAVCVERPLIPSVRRWVGGFLRPGHINCRRGRQFWLFTPHATVNLSIAITTVIIPSLVHSLPRTSTRTTKLQQGTFCPHIAYCGNLLL